MGTHIAELETPRVVLDRDAVLHNIRRVRSIAARHGVRVRPHAKSHKCLEIARLQMQEGAVGLTCAKTDEAIAFIEGGVASITVAYPIIGESKIERLLVAAREAAAEVRLTVDSELGVEVIAGVSRHLGVRTDVFLKIDVGLHRCGVEKDSPEMVSLAIKTDRHPSLRLAGILSHAGHAYGVETLEEVKQIAEQERVTMLEAQDTLRAQGLEVAEVSVGSTPTVLAAGNLAGITEIRPGNYVFMDRTPLRFRLTSLREIALSVVATVVSRNRRYLIVDAGSKVLSSDLGGHGFRGAAGFGLALPLGQDAEPEEMLCVEKLSEEHGWIARQGRGLALGTVVRIVPNHSCAVANLADRYTVCDRDGRVVDEWRVIARGKVL